MPVRSELRTRTAALILTACALSIGAISARPFAGSWNDGSRLASVEALADHGTFAIDRSVFVQVPKELIATGHPPYEPGNELLLKHGTRDKLFIDGHYYTDKPPVATVLMAGIYRVWQAFGGPRFAERPDLACWFLTLATSGLAYAISVCCLWLLARRLGLDTRLALLLTSSFAFSTVALPYVRHVNNHILLLGVMSALMLQLVRLRDDLAGGRTPWLRLALIGTLGGFGYTLDLGIGPVLIMCLSALVMFRCRPLPAVSIFVAGMLPWLAAHHAINYSIGGTIGPANAVPEYLNWPGSPFGTDNMTGLIRHGPGKLVVYALELLFGKHGFVLHNLPLLLVLPAAICTLRRGDRARPEMLFGLAFCIGGWLLYAAFSNNSGGACCSVRWFVPFLAPGFYAIAELLQRKPEFRIELSVLAAWGAVLGVSMWSVGPFTLHMVPLYWPIVVGALLTLAVTACQGRFGFIWHRLPQFCTFAWRSMPMRRRRE